MSRVEEKRLKQVEKLNKIKLTINFTIIFILLLICLYSGLTAVNINNRSMLLLEERELLSLSSISDTEYKINFMGNNYVFDSNKVFAFIKQGRNLSNASIDKIKTAIYEKSLSLKDSIHGITKN